VPSPHSPLAIAEGRPIDTATDRFMLRPRRKIEVLTSTGGKRKAFCEETVVLGGGCSAVYEKLV
jgi:hypothetical protein